MARYNDELYVDTLNALIGDIYYAVGVSIDAKVARMRKLAEVIVRRLTSYNTRSALTLGDYRTRRALDDRGMTEQFLRDAIAVLNREGSESTHSKQTELPTEEELERVSKALTDLFAYLFYDHFKRYEFGSNDEVMSAFSTLPPFLRLTVLQELVHNGHVNKDVVEKLALAAVKSLGTEGAVDWVEANRETLSSVDAPFGSEDIPVFFQHFQLIGSPLEFPLWLEVAGGSVCDYLLWRIPRISVIESRPVEFAYQTFEEAKRKYLEYGIIEGNDEETVEYNAITRFVFEGRKSDEAREFELCTKDLVEALKEFRSYCDAMKIDDEIGDEIAVMLSAARNDIDQILGEMP